MTSHAVRKFSLLGPNHHMQILMMTLTKMGRDTGSNCTKYQVAAAHHSEQGICFKSVPLGAGLRADST
jgi:hypothetical protein